jgi:hypothetical protein
VRQLEIEVVEYLSELHGAAATGGPEVSASLHKNRCGKSFCE